MNNNNYHTLHKIVDNHFWMATPALRYPVALAHMAEITPLLTHPVNRLTWSGVVWYPHVGAVSVLIRLARKTNQTAELMNSVGLSACISNAVIS